MKKTITFIIILLALTACTASKPTATQGPFAADPSQVGMANPASVYCTQNGGKLDIRTASGGSQSGVCVFPDGSSCDEWAYFRGECGFKGIQSPVPATTYEASGGYMSPGTSEPITDWWGVIKSSESDTQYDDYFERQDMGSVINFGIDSLIPEVKSHIEALRDSGKIIHIYGTLLSNMPDFNGSLIQVDRIEVEE